MKSPLVLEALLTVKHWRVSTMQGSDIHTKHNLPRLGISGPDVDLARSAFAALVPACSQEVDVPGNLRKRGRRLDATRRHVAGCKRIKCTHGKHAFIRAASRLYDSRVSPVPDLMFTAPPCQVFPDELPACKLSGSPSDLMASPTRTADRLEERHLEK